MHCLAGVLLCGLYMFSLCLRGFYSGISAHQLPPTLKKTPIRLINGCKLFIDVNSWLCLRDGCQLGYGSRNAEVDKWLRK